VYRVSTAKIRKKGRTEALVKRQVPIQEEQILFVFSLQSQPKVHYGILSQLLLARKVQKQRKSRSKIVAIKNNKKIVIALITTLVT
jgi:hypothetical protein